MYSKELVKLLEQDGWKKVSQKRFSFKNEKTENK